MSDSEDDVLKRPAKTYSGAPLLVQQDVLIVPKAQYELMQLKIDQLSSENEQLRRAVSRGKREEGSRLNNRPSRSPKHSAARGTRTTSRSRSRSRIARSRSRGRGRLSPAAAAEEKRRRSHSGDRYNDADELVSSEDAGGGGPEDEFVVGAVQICNRLTEVYNRKVPANIGMEKKGLMVSGKMEEFMQCFGDQIAVKMIDGRDILGSLEALRVRYQCVFGESGAELQMITHKRFFFEAKSGGRERRRQITLCLDFEEHRHLISALAGTHPDGREGLTKPRTQIMMALYVCWGNKVQQMWMAPDKEKLGPDVKLGRKELEKHPQVQPMLKFIETNYPEQYAGNCVFNAYHNIETIG